MRNLCLLLLACGPALADGGHPLTLWQLDGERNTIFILGSVHLLRAEDHPLPSRIDEAYREAERIIMEIDMDDLDPVAMQSMINRLGLLEEGQSLEDLMGAELYAEAQELAERMEIPLELLARTEPWLAAITIEQMALARIGFNPNYGVELHITSKARADGKPIDGLETVDEQIAFLDGLSMDAQRDLLMQTLDEGVDIESMMDLLIAAWRRGDVAYFAETILKDFQAFPELYEAIIAGRNRRWVEQISLLLDDDDDYLVVVGALHLVGPDGVPQLLKDRGKNISQLSQPQPEK